MVLSSWKSGVNIIFWTMNIRVFSWRAPGQAEIIRASFVDQDLPHTPHKSLSCRSSDPVLLSHELRAITGRHGELVKLGNDFPEGPCPLKLVLGVLKVDGRHREGNVSSCGTVCQRNVQGVHALCNMESRVNLVVAYQPLWRRSQQMINQKRNSLGGLGATVEERWK